MLNKIKIGAIIQARMNSSRLPGKVLMKLPIQSEFTVLDRIISRIPQAFDYHIGTSTLPNDDKIFNRYYNNVYRGDEDDVLSRFYKIALANNYDVIIRLTGDNPCIDPNYLLRTVNYNIESGFDYTRSSGLPLGCNIEVFSFKALDLAYHGATSLAEKEHVTLYMKNNPKIFKINTINFNFVSEILDMRLTMDYPSDYALLNLLFSVLPENFSLEDLCDFVKDNKWVKDINFGNKQRIT